MTTSAGGRARGGDHEERRGRQSICSRDKTNEAAEINTPPANDPLTTLISRFIAIRDSRPRAELLVNGRKATTL
ncbi:hypothetical protein GWI33_010871 [Rhynchophorus ferrugineus]|uniref:Uncharacterized protein n=1 Tax=Rhynchophorus ferrugineus TaxID=354439 RepID=A0A834IAJ5_RHYFE|nr:hypothetical protein GWI33_010871 [Rhynchophorus ferrugineus]